MSTPKQTRISARERIQEAHRREARAAALRRRLLLGGAITAVIAVIAVGVVALSSSGDKATGPMVTPANASGPDGTVIVYGHPDAKHTLQVYEDFRCPICHEFEESAGQTVQQLADNGDYKIEYHLAAFLDGNLGGKGSRAALAAAGAALNEGVDKFKQFHDVLYANQPDEHTDGFGDVNHLLDLAGKVPGLKTDAFTKAVTDGTYQPWAAKVASAFNGSGVQGTPTMVLDGKPLNVFTANKPVTGEQFSTLVHQAIGG